MQTITMTNEQTARYDADDLSLMSELRGQAQALANATGDTAEVYTVDGIVALAVTPDQLQTSTHRSQT